MLRKKILLKRPLLELPSPARACTYSFRTAEAEPIPPHDLFPGFEEAVAAAEEGAAATSNMEALAGRANYVAAETLKGVPDPGAKAAAYALKALLKELSG